MAYFVYTVVYAEKSPGVTYVLGFTKRKIGYFFKDKAISRYGQDLRGGGLFAFPGGKRDGGETSIDGGLREFWEETGIGLRRVTLVRPVHEYAGAGFSGIMVKVSYADLTSLASRIDTMLDTANDAAIDVSRGYYAVGTNLTGYYGPMPQDNEMLRAAAELVTPSLISYLDGSTSTNWFAEMLRNLP